MFQTYLGRFSLLSRKIITEIFISFVVIYYIEGLAGSIYQINNRIQKKTKASNFPSLEK